MKNIISLICRLFLILVFGYTAYHKLFDINGFEETLLKSTLIDENQIIYILYALPTIEIITVMLLLIKNNIYGLYLSLFLMLMFTAYLVALNNFSFYKGCSCGGIFNELSYQNHIIVNIILIIFSVTSILFFKKHSN